MQSIFGNVLHKSVGELPAHNHSAWTNSQGWHNHGVGIWNDTGVGGDKFSSYATRIYSGYVYVDGNGNHTHSVGIGNTGSSQSHNIMQPYIAVYIWKRKS